MTAGVAQWVERAFRKRQVAGSMPAAGFIRVARVAQGVRGEAGMGTRDFNGLGGGTVWTGLTGWMGRRVSDG